MDNKTIIYFWARHHPVNSELTVIFSIYFGFPLGFWGSYLCSIEVMSHLQGPTKLGLLIALESQEHLGITRPVLYDIVIQ